MLHPFRSALLVIAALSAATVAPAQVRPGAASEPLLSGMDQMPALVVPATLDNPELPATPPTLGRGRRVTWADGRCLRRRRSAGD